MTRSVSNQEYLSCIQELQYQHAIVLLKDELKESLLKIWRCKQILARSQIRDPDLSTMSRRAQKLFSKISNLKGSKHLEKVQTRIEIFISQVGDHYQALLLIREQCKLLSLRRGATDDKPFTGGQAKISSETAGYLPPITPDPVS